VITISGELEKGDADKFGTAISGFDHLLVELNGPGGLLEEGLIVGREIRARHFATGVAPDWRGKDEGNPLNDETAQAYGIEAVFIGEAAPLNRAISVNGLDLNRPNRRSGRNSFAR